MLSNEASPIAEYTARSHPSAGMAPGGAGTPPAQTFVWTGRDDAPFPLQCQTSEHPAPQRVMLHYALLVGGHRYVSPHI